MKRIWLWSIAAIVSVGALVWVARRSPSSAPPSVASSATPQPQPTETIQYHVYTLPQATIHTLLIPLQRQWRVVPVQASTVASLAAMAQQQGAIAALNGGFFDPENQQSTSYIVRDGRLIADPHQNDRLMSNPALQPYLSQILNRTELRRYQCSTGDRYDLALHAMAPPAGCRLIDALGGGPRLLPDLTATTEGFIATANGVIIRDALGSTQPNARTAIGLTRDGHMLWVMAAQKPATSTSGMTIAALAAFMQQLGAVQAMNLDGGSSSALYYNGKTIYGKVDSHGQRVQRSVKSMLVVPQP